MLPHRHIVYGFLAALALYLIFPAIGLLEFSLIFLASFLVDVDHYMSYVWKTGNPSLPKAYRYLVKKRQDFINLSFKQRKQYLKAYKRNIFIFHGMEFILFLIILSLFYPLIFWVIIGVTIHLLIDFHELMGLKINLLSKMSQIYVYFDNKGKKYEAI